MHHIIKSSELSEKNKIDFISSIINKGIYIDVYDKQNMTPFHIACSYQLSKVINFLISKGCDINKKDINLETGLHKLIKGYDAKCQIIKKDPYLINKETNKDILIIENAIIKKLYTIKNEDMTYIQNLIMLSDKLFNWDVKSLNITKKKLIENILSDKKYTNDQKINELTNIMYEYKNTLSQTISDKMKSTLTELSYLNEVDKDKIFKNDDINKMNERIQTKEKELDEHKNKLKNKLNEIDNVITKLKLNFITEGIKELSAFDSYMNQIIWFLYGYYVNSDTIDFNKILQILKISYDVPKTDIELDKNDDITTTIKEYNLKLTVDSPKIVRLPVSMLKDVEIKESWKTSVTNDKNNIDLINIGFTVKKLLIALGKIHNPLYQFLITGVTNLGTTDYHTTGVQGNIYDVLNMNVNSLPYINANQTNPINIIQIATDYIKTFNFDNVDKEFINKKIVSGFRKGKNLANKKNKEEDNFVIDYNINDIITMIAKLTNIKKIYDYIFDVKDYAQKNNIDIATSAVHSILDPYLKHFTEFTATVNDPSIDDSLKSYGINELMVDYIKQNLNTDTDSVNSYLIHTIELLGKLRDNYLIYNGMKPFEITGYEPNLEESKPIVLNGNTTETKNNLVSSINYITNATTNEIQIPFAYVVPVLGANYTTIEFDSIIQYSSYYIKRIYENFSIIKSLLNDSILKINKNINDDYYTQIMYCVVPILNIFLLLNNLAHDHKNIKIRFDELKNYLKNKIYDENNSFNFYIDNVMNICDEIIIFINSVNLNDLYENIHDMLELLNFLIDILNTLCGIKYNKAINDNSANINEIYDNILPNINIFYSMDDLEKEFNYINSETKTNYRKKIYQEFVNQITLENYTTYYKNSITLPKLGFIVKSGTNLYGDPELNNKIGIINIISDASNDKIGNIGKAMSLIIDKNKPSTILSGFIDEHLFNIKLKIIKEMLGMPFYDADGKDIIDDYIENKIKSNKKEKKYTLIASIN